MVSSIDGMIVNISQRFQHQRRRVAALHKPLAYNPLNNALQHIGTVKIAMLDDGGNMDGDQT